MQGVVLGAGEQKRHALRGPPTHRCQIPVWPQLVPAPSLCSRPLVPNWGTRGSHRQTDSRGTTPPRLRPEEPRHACRDPCQRAREGIPQTSPTKQVDPPPWSLSSGAEPPPTMPMGPMVGTSGQTPTHPHQKARPRQPTTQEPGPRPQKACR